MTQGLEWGSIDQFVLLCKSGLLGMVLGFAFEIATGIGRMKTKGWKFIADMLFCVVAAFITFYANLVFTDGLLHPVLFLGIVLGVFAEHYCVGKWISLIVYKSAYKWREVTGIATKSIRALLRKFRSNLLKKSKRVMDRGEKVKKMRKKHHFFQKKA